MKYYCQVCERDLEHQEEGLLFICCDRCLQWMHLSCTSLKAAPKKKEWFCQLCKDKSAHIESTVNRLQLKRDKRKLKLSKPTQCKECIPISSSEEKIDDQYTYEVTPGTKVLQSDFDLLKNRSGWLNRRLIYAGQELLKKKFPKVCGLHDVGKCKLVLFSKKGVNLSRYCIVMSPTGF